MKRWLCAWDMLIFHAKCALRAEFARYRLHFLWWFLDPVLHLVVLYLVFGVFLASPEPHYPFFLLAGIIVWQWFASTVNHAPNSIYASMRMFQQYKVHPIHFPLCVFLQDLAKYIPVLLFFLAIIAIFGPQPLSAQWLGIIPVMLVEGMCILACAILVAALVPFLPDLSLVVGIAIQILFFASGIFFNIDAVVLEKHRGILFLNPNAVCIRAMRSILINGEAPDWPQLGQAALSSTLIFLAAFLIVTKCRKIYPRIINQ